ncbi:MAG: hypothetical protein JOY73_07340 [Actinobacteria bacterium]|nr:hypothetical protein [Actinomycetota bacterium]
MGAGGDGVVLATTSYGSGVPLAVLVVSSLCLGAGVLLAAKVFRAVRSSNTFRKSLIEVLAEGDDIRDRLIQPTSPGGMLAQSVRAQISDWPKVQTWTDKAAVLVGDRTYFKKEIPPGPTIPVLAAFMDDRLKDLRRLLERS